MAANIATKFVNIIESNVNNEPAAPNDGGYEGSETAVTNSGTGFGSSGSGSTSTATATPPSRRTSQRQLPLLEEIVFAEPTFWERFMRYFVIVFYLSVLCSLGFFLSVYHIFFWDSRMPPVHKTLVTKKPFIFVKP